MSFIGSKSNWDQFVLANNLTSEDILFFQRMAPSKYVVSVNVIIVLCVLYGITSMLAITGNLLVIIVVLSRKRMRTVTNIFIANLAFADILLGMFVIPFQFQTAILQRWAMPAFLCKFAPFVKNMSVSVSVLSLTLISIDRYIAVLYPLKAGFHFYAAGTLLIIIWIIAIGTSIPDAVYFQTNAAFDIHELQEKTVCIALWVSENFRKWYMVFLFLEQYALPLVIITLSYMRVTSRICLVKQPGIQIGGRKTSLRDRNRSKAVKMLIIVVSLFAVCWLPLQVYNLLVPFYKNKITSFKHIYIVWLAINWLAMSNACYNPFIYGLLNEKFKTEFKYILTRCICRCGKVIRTKYRRYS